MYQFNYHQPSSLAEAREIFSNAEDPAYLSGGQTLIATLKQRLASPSDLIDLSGIAEMSGIEVSRTSVIIGGFVRHADVANSAEIKAAIPALAHLAGLIGDAQVRNRGTIGGSVANSDPAADYPAAVVALKATVYTDQRLIPGDEFFSDLFETALEPGELVRCIEFSMPTRCAYSKFPNPASRYAVVGVMVADFDGDIQVGITGAGACAFRHSGLEAALNKDLSGEACDSAAIDFSDFNTDLHASAEYRGQLVKVMAKRAVAAL
jgi:carbon-monoxide dehydrogenase medium subunit